MFLFSWMRLTFLRQSRQVIHAHPISSAKRTTTRNGDFSFSGFVADIGANPYQNVPGHLALAEAIFFPKLPDSFVQRCSSFPVVLEAFRKQDTVFPRRSL